MRPIILKALLVSFVVLVSIPVFPAYAKDKPFTKLDLKCIDRFSGYVIGHFFQRQRLIMGDDLEMSLRLANQDLVARYATSSQSIIKGDDFIIGRLNPVYISLKRNGKGKSDLLVAGLDRLVDGELVVVRISVDGTCYSFDLSNSACNMYGVFRKSLDVDIESADLSIDLTY